ncbi:MAG: RNA 2',3'-cyclic phosphodiesterase [Thiotrichales bacterium]|nr:MAG: RNA 2',3'-cyclic phosphodiesterase [Thiotrichales bacterium]
MAENHRRRRLFLALWPDDITRAKLAGVQRQIGMIDRLKTARAVPAANLHITTHFLGAVSDGVKTRLEPLLSEVRARPCTLRIDRWGYFPKAKVLWLGAAASPAALTELVEQTQTCIQACIEGYAQKRFVPHITVFRKARHPLEVDDFDPIEWRIDRFALVESVTHPEGPEYTVLKEWLLS